MMDRIRCFLKKIFIVISLQTDIGKILGYKFAKLVTWAIKGEHKKLDKGLEGVELEWKIF